MCSDSNYQLIGTWSRSMNAGAQYMPIGPMGPCGATPPPSGFAGAPGVQYGMPGGAMYGNQYGDSSMNMGYRPISTYTGPIGAYGGPGAMMSNRGDAWASFNRGAPALSPQVAYSGSYSGGGGGGGSYRPNVPQTPAESEFTPEPPYMEPDMGLS